MLSVQALQELGVNTQEGLSRCVNNEDFYLRMVEMGLQDERFIVLKKTLEAGDLDAAFEAAHALKGVLGNLALTPLCEPVFEITELLRVRTQMDYGPLAEKILSEREKITALI